MGGGGVPRKRQIIEIYEKVRDIRKTLNKYQYFENVIAKTRKDTKQAHQRSKRTKVYLGRIPTFDGGRTVFRFHLTSSPGLPGVQKVT